MITREEICKEYGINDIGDFSDGFHTFNELYHQRAVLFATIVKQTRVKRGSLIAMKTENFVSVAVGLSPA